MKNILRDITESGCNESSNGNLFRAALCAILLGIGLVNGAGNYAHFKIDGRYEKKPLEILPFLHNLAYQTILTIFILSKILFTVNERKIL